MGHPGEDEFRIRVKGTLEEAAEVGSGGCPVETVVVIEDANAHELPGKTFHHGRSGLQMQVGQLPPEQ
jgi:hypothetical protein